MAKAEGTDEHNGITVDAYSVWRAVFGVQDLARHLGASSVKKPLGSLELSKLILGLVDDIQNAHIHWRYHAELHKALSDTPEVYAHSRAFWSFTLSAHSHTATQFLARAFDTEPRALSLVYLLRSVQANLGEFDGAHYRMRLGANPCVESLVADYSPPDPTELALDISLCGRNDPLVKRLIRHRGNLLAHRNAAGTVGNTLQSFSMSYDDVDALMLRANTIVNRYSGLFSANFYSTKVIGQDDYKFIFSTVSAAVDRSIKEIEDSIARAAAVDYGLSKGAG